MHQSGFLLQEATDPADGGMFWREDTQRHTHTHAHTHTHIYTHTHIDMEQARLGACFVHPLNRSNSCLQLHVFYAANRDIHTTEKKRHI